MKKFDVVVLGAGPGGYVAAIRASQLGKKVAIIEEDRLGGVCLNRGCIPTKALLKSASAVHEIKEMKELGIDVELRGLKSEVAVGRANQIAERISKGVSFLMKKNHIEVVLGRGQFKSKNIVEVRASDGNLTEIEAKHILISTGAKYRSFPGLVHDGKRLIGAYEALKLEKLPAKIGIIGAGAIGVEFAYFWNAFGVEVSIFEMQDHLLPIEDEESSLEIEKAYKKYGIKTYLGVKKVQAKNLGTKAEITAEIAGKEERFECDICLIAVGMTGNIEGIGLESIGVKTEKGFISVNEFGQTSVPHIYAIGDVSGPPLLAHAASHEGVLAVEHLAGLPVHAIDKKNIPGCTYCVPQVASVGYTERELKAKKIEYKVGKLPFIANGKAVASNQKDGFVKVLMGQYGELLGAHIVGAEATELIHEYTLFKTMEGIDEEIFATVHPHPTLGEWLGEAVLAAKGRALNF